MLWESVLGLSHVVPVCVGGCQVLWKSVLGVVSCCACLCWGLPRVMEVCVGDV